MILVLQSLAVDLSRLIRLVGETQAATMCFTSSHRTLLDQVLVETNQPGRTIVISSSVFHGDGPHDHATKHLTPDILARTVKAMDPHAWFFLYSISPRVGEGIDGVIPKMTDERILEFLSLDFKQVSSLDELYHQLPWIRPNS